MRAGAAVGIRHRAGVRSRGQSGGRGVGAAQRTPGIGVRSRSAVRAHARGSVRQAKARGVGLPRSRAQGRSGLGNRGILGGGAALRIRGGYGVRSGRQVGGSRSRLHGCGVPRIGIGSGSAGGGCLRQAGGGAKAQNVVLAAGDRQRSRGLIDDCVHDLYVAVGVRNRAGVAAGD